MQNIKSWYNPSSPNIIPTSDNARCSFSLPPLLSPSILHAPDQTIDFIKSLRNPARFFFSSVATLFSDRDTWTRRRRRRRKKKEKKRERSVAGMPSAKSRKIFYTWAWHKRCRERWQGHFDIEDVYAPISGAVNFNPCDGLSAFPPPQPPPLLSRHSFVCWLSNDWLLFDKTSISPASEDFRD